MARGGGKRERSPLYKTGCPHLLSELDSQKNRAVIYHMITSRTVASSLSFYSTYSWEGRDICSSRPYLGQYCRRVLSDQTDQWFQYRRGINRSSNDYKHTTIGSNLKKYTRKICICEILVRGYHAVVTSVEFSDVAAPLVADATLRVRPMSLNTLRRSYEHCMSKRPEAP